MKSSHRPGWLVAGFLVQLSLVGCGSDTETPGLPALDAGLGGGATGSQGTGGKSVGQGGGSVSTGTGGATSATGGTATGNGGTVSSSGGTSTGGTAATGGSSTGGKASGGTSSATGGKATTGGNTSSGGTVAASGGSGSGGKSTGGTGTGGTATGGTKATGGVATGGVSSGGVSTGGIKATGGTATGGTATGGVATGGTKATGGTATGGVATGGTKATGGTATGGTTTTPNIGPAACGCTTSSGEFSGNQVSSTIVVDAGENYDGGCKTYRANPSTLGPGDQSEGQSPVFRVNGGTLSNVILGASAADGIHIYGSTTLKNIHWLDIGEDAMTVKAAATMTLDCGSSNQGEDKTFQVNAASTITIKNFTAKNAGKLMRQNGDTTFKMSVTIDHCDISGMAECIYRTDSSTSTVTMTNTRYSNIGDSLFIFGSTGVNGNSSQSTVTNCQSY